MSKSTAIFLNCLPIIVMMALIHFVKNEFALTGLYVIIILISFAIHREKNEKDVFLFGFLIMTIFEFFFIRTGVETFTQHSLFNVMPLWLPFLWAYCFVAIKRAVLIIDR